MTHFHSENLYFYIHYSNSLKVTALYMFQRKLGSHPNNNGSKVTETIHIFAVLC